MVTSSSVGFYLLSPSSILDFFLASPVVKLLRSCVLHCSLHQVKLQSETNLSLHLYSFRYDGWRSIHQDVLNIGPAHGRRYHQVKGDTAGTLKRMTEMLNLKNNETLKKKSDFSYVQFDILKRQRSNGIQNSENGL